MRNLDRDRQRVVIARFQGTTPVERGGRLTGRNEPSYSAQEVFWPTVGVDKGQAVYDLFGQKLDYDVTLTVDDPAFDVKEADILWVYAADSAEHDHVVRRVARKGSYTVMAAQRVEVAK